MSNKSDLQQAILDWNTTNSPYRIDWDITYASPRRVLLLTVYHKDKPIIQFRGYEGEEFLWAEIIERLNMTV